MQQVRISAKKVDGKQNYGKKMIVNLILKLGQGKKRKVLKKRQGFFLQKIK